MTVKKAKRDLIVAYFFEFLAACQFGLLYLSHIADERILDVPLKITVFTFGSIGITIFICFGAYYISLCREALRDAEEEAQIDAIFEKRTYNPDWQKS